jgi:predicted kinase
MDQMPTLIIFAGLPGTGKTTLSQRLAQRISATHLRIDTIEQGLRDLCGIRVEGEGYRLAYRIAADNLRLGLNVVADSCNPLELTRREWEQVAKENAAKYVNIEVTCSNLSEHQRRVESRATNISGLRLPTWQDVTRREYHEWSVDRIVIDTAEGSPDESLDALMTALAGNTGRPDHTMRTEPPTARGLNGTITQQPGDRDGLA